EAGANQRAGQIDDRIYFTGVMRADELDALAFEDHAAAVQQPMISVAESDDPFSVDPSPHRPLDSPRRRTASVRKQYDCASVPFRFQNGIIGDRSRESPRTIHRRDYRV